MSCVQRAAGWGLTQSVFHAAARLHYLQLRRHLGHAALGELGAQPHHGRASDELRDVGLCSERGVAQVERVSTEVPGAATGALCWCRVQLRGAGSSASAGSSGETRLAAVLRSHLDVLRHLAPKEAQARAGRKVWAHTATHTTKQAERRSERGSTRWPLLPAVSTRSASRFACRVVALRMADARVTRHAAVLSLKAQSTSDSEVRQRGLGQSLTHTPC